MNTNVLRKPVPLGVHDQRCVFKLVVGEGGPTRFEGECQDLLRMGWDLHLETFRAELDSDGAAAFYIIASKVVIES